MSNIERYKEIIQAALKVYQLEYERKEQLEIISKNMLVSELKEPYTMCAESAANAFKIILNSGVLLEGKEGNSELLTIHYKNIYKYLHCDDPTNTKDSRKAMKDILGDINIK